MYRAGYKFKSERNNPWFKPWFNILLHKQSMVCATVWDQCLEYLVYITLQPICFFYKIEPKKRRQKRQSHSVVSILQGYNKAFCWSCLVLIPIFKHWLIPWFLLVIHPWIPYLFPTAQCEVTCLSLFHWDFYQNYPRIR